MKKVKQACLLALAVSAVSVAHAGFAVEDGSAPGARAGSHSTMSDTLASPGVTQLGAAATKQPLVKGMARDVSLLTALKQVVPSGWAGKKVGGIDENRLVSWQGGNRSWVEVLHELAVTYGFSATVDWGKMEVTVAPAGWVGSSWKDEANVVAPVNEGAAKAEPEKAKTWVLKTDKTLKENLEQWAKEEGWSVSWGGVDYPVSVEVALTGKWDDENGPIGQLAQAYRSAEQPLNFTFYSNKVLRVENAAYKQIPQQNQMPNHRAMQ